MTFVILRYQGIRNEPGGDLFLPEKWVRRPEGENMIRAISMPQRTESS